LLFAACAVLIALNVHAQTQRIMWEISRRVSRRSIPTTVREDAVRATRRLSDLASIRTG